MYFAWSASGWVPVRPQDFRAQLADNIHVVGDATIAAPMPKSGFCASAQAKVVAAAIAAAKSPIERTRAVEALEKQLVADCEAEAGFRCRLYSFLGGNTYRLFRNIEIRDVRLVYAPAGGIGSFGGGDVTVQAAGDVVDLQVASPTSVLTARAGTAETLTQWEIGGGNIAVAAGGALRGGRIGRVGHRRAGYRVLPGPHWESPRTPGLVRSGAGTRGGSRRARRRPPASAEGLRSCCAWCAAVRLVSDGAHAVGLRALGTLGDLELDALRLLEAAVAGGVDGGVVNEHVGAAAVLGDEAEALLSVEPLNGALCHGVNPSSDRQVVPAPRGPPVDASPPQARAPAGLVLDPGDRGLVLPGTAAATAGDASREPGPSGWSDRRGLPWINPVQRAFP